ncbi:hypothetical protein [Ferruginibacter sp. HRS2-29]|uniref:hypothetical protein n=1 Tax=Ferruginibacter sp. HRS2-29 TaxID=2487334 RepID=UPI0020CE56D6|nr:hypothetical protein [Ferruginibacter sp. HRS2-29]MCP9752440.1 hypothetical protein [Ferruginibacter sp. HRS2-29]
MKYVIIFISAVMFYSCVKNEECKQQYIGSFQIDTTLISNNKLKPYLKKYNWIKIVLRSDSTGHYSFEGADPFLKECEGTWSISSNNMEGNCTGFLTQKNIGRKVDRQPFDILIKIDGESYFLPFRKVGN